METIAIRESIFIVRRTDAKQRYQRYKYNVHTRFVCPLHLVIMSCHGVITDIVTNLGVIVDENLSLDKHMAKVSIAVCVSIRTLLK